MVIAGVVSIQVHSTPSWRNPQLYEITSVNALVMTVAIGVLTLAAAIAGIIPVRRAASIDPVRALRIE
jgi:macrolide transport system ATP-binding/permease protein